MSVGFAAALYFYWFDGYDTPGPLFAIGVLLNVIFAPGTMAAQLAACLMNLCSFDAPGFVVTLGGITLQCYLLFVLGRFAWLKIRSRSSRNTAGRT